MFEEEIKFLQEIEEPNNDQNKRDKLNDEQIIQLQNEFSGLPEDYLAYLREIGWGSFRQCQFGVFQCCYFEDLYDIGVEFEEKRYIAFGHNFSVDTSVFDAKDNFEVYDFWHDCLEFYKADMTFKQYIRRCMLMSE